MEASLTLQRVSQRLLSLATGAQECAQGHRWGTRFPFRQVGEIRKRRIHLTFDDGPHPTNTPMLLDELRGAGIQATFFVMGKHLETSVGQELIHRAASDGHQIGNHTYSHPRLTELTEHQIRHEISKTEQLIGSVDKGIKILRPPYGAHNPLVDRVALELGYSLVLWNVDTNDWDPEYHYRWVEYAMKKIVTEDQSVVLAHDNQTTTVARVGALVAQIQKLPGSSFIGYSEAFPPGQDYLQHSTTNRPDGVKAVAADVVGGIVISLRRTIELCWKGHA